MLKSIIEELYINRSTRFECFFFLGEIMNYKKDILIRITKDFDSYLNQSAEFFGVSKSYFVREQCFTNSFFKTIGADLDEAFLEDYNSIGHRINLVAHEMNSMLLEFKDSTRPDFILDSDYFNPLVDIVYGLEDDWGVIVDFRVKHLCDYSYEDFNFEYEPLDINERKSKNFHLRVNEDFFCCLKLLANAKEKSISQYIIDCCSSVDYVQASSAFENDDMGKVLYMPNNNIRQILRVINSLEILCKRNYNLDVINKNKFLYKLKDACTLFYEDLKKNESYELSCVKEWYKKVSTRNITDEVREVLKDETVFLKKLKNKSNRL